MSYSTPTPRTGSYAKNKLTEKVRNPGTWKHLIQLNPREILDPEDDLVLQSLIPEESSDELVDRQYPLAQSWSVMTWDGRSERPSLPSLSQLSQGKAMTYTERFLNTRAQKLHQKPSLRYLTIQETRSNKALQRMHQ